LVLAKKDEVPKVQKATDIIVQSKQNRILALGVAKKKDQISTFKKMSKGVKGVYFMYSQEKDIFDRYDLKEDDLPAMVLLRNFNDAGKDLRNRRDTVVYKAGSGEWSQSALRDFIMTQGVAPILPFPGNGPDEQSAIDLAFSSPMPKIFFIWKKKEDKQMLEEIFKNTADEKASKYFGKVSSFAVDWGSAHDEVKKQIKSMTGEDKIQVPMAVLNAGSQKTSLKGKELSLERLKKMLDGAIRGDGSEEGPDEGEEGGGGGDSVEGLRRELAEVAKKKDAAIEREDFKEAKELKARAEEIKKKIKELDPSPEL